MTEVQKQDGTNEPIGTQSAQELTPLEKQQQRIKEIEQKEEQFEKTLDLKRDEIDYKKNSKGLTVKDYKLTRKYRRHKRQLILKQKTLDALLKQAPELLKEIKETLRSYGFDVKEDMAAVDIDRLISSEKTNKNSVIEWHDVKEYVVSRHAVTIKRKAIRETIDNKNKMRARILIRLKKAGLQNTF